MPKRKYKLADWEMQLILQKYDGRTSTIDAIEHDLGHRYPRWYIKRRAAEMDLARQKEQRWSEAEELWLEKNLPKKRWRDLARELNRTVTAVKLKAKRLRLTKTADGCYTARGAALILGCDEHKVIRWVDAGLLAADRYLTDRVPQQGGDPYRIQPHAIKAFILRYPGEIDLRRVDKYAFIDILAAGSRRAQVNKADLCQVS
ncbi:MAG: hypothetical protein WAO55_04555 [Candidatus Manganitrophaceae bacterium]